MNTSYTARAVIIAALIALGGCAGVGTKTGEYVDDSVITSKVKSDFALDKQVSAMNISVTTTDGVVQLTGHAHDRSEAQKAEQIARKVRGVKAVRNHILVE